MFTKSDTIKLVIENVAHLEQCIHQLKSSNAISECHLHFACWYLSDENIKALKEAFIKQNDIKTLLIKISFTETKMAASLLDILTTLLAGNLKSLTLKGLHMDKQQSEILAAALQKNKTLIYLDMQHTFNQSASIKSIIESLSHHPTLKTLDLSNNLEWEWGLDEQYYVREEILKLVKNNQVLDKINIGTRTDRFVFDGASKTKEEFSQLLKALANVSTLRELTFDLKIRPTKGELSALKNIISKQTKLNKLSLRGYSCWVFNELCEDKLLNHELTAIDLKGDIILSNKASDFFSKFISDNRILKCLSLSFLSSINTTKAICVALKNSQSLERLKLDQIAIDVEYLADMIRYNKSLKSLTIKNSISALNKDKEHSLLKAVAENTGLDSITIRENKISFPQNWIEKFEKNTRLLYLDIIDYLNRIQHKTLCLLEYDIDYKDYIAINQVLERNFYLRVFHPYLLIKAIVYTNNLPQEFCTTMFYLLLDLFSKAELQKIANVIKEKNNQVLFSNDILVEDNDKKEKTEFQTDVECYPPSCVIF